jgi:hypothetical protein
VFRNKQDENGVIMRNKARLVAQGYTQVEAIQILLAYVTSYNISYIKWM